MNRVQRVCVFGGTFDPIHNAHLRIAREAQQRCGVDRMLFIPAGRPPHKQSDSVTPFEDRYRMVELACKDQAGFEPSRLEEPPNSSYSIDTIVHLRSQLPREDELFFLIGSDAFDEIESWKRWQELATLVTFIVATRPGTEYKTLSNVRSTRLDSVALEVSSSEIRDLLATGTDTLELPTAVLAYIKEHQLYGWEPSHSQR